MSQEEFKNVKFEFKTDEDPQTHKKIELHFTNVDFKRVEGPAAEAILKMAAF